MVKLLNDFQAIGYASPGLKTEDLHELQRGSEEPKTSFVIVGSGTGLGVVFAEKIDGKTHVLSSEGGHTFLGATCADDEDYAQYVVSEMNKRYPEKKLTYAHSEYLFCGIGLALLYNFFYYKHNKKYPELELQPKQIIEKFQQDAVGRDCLNMYLRIVGRIINQLSKIFVKDGSGLIMCGTIKYVWDIVYKKDTKRFWEALSPYFYADPVFEKSFQRMGIYLTEISTGDLGVAGCVNYFVEQD